MTRTHPFHRVHALGALVLIGAFLALPLGGEASGQDVPDLDSFCRTRASLEALFGTDDKQAVETALTTLETDAPPEVAANAKVVAEQLLKKGEDAFGSKKFRTALDAVNDYSLANCPLNKIAVTAVDYSFEGIPANIPPGPTAFTFTNGASDEEHEIVIFRVKPKVTLSATKLLALSEKQLGKQVEFVSASNAKPGDSAVGFANLEPGRYLASCFIPVGGKQGGKPHWREGMYAEFTVTVT